MRVIVTGGRNYNDVNTIARVLGTLYHEVILVHGDCPTGADAHAWYLWKEVWRNTDEPHPADWNQYGKRAGFVRNEEMAAAGADLCIAFPGNNGTEDMIRRAKAHGITVVRVDA